jgi:1-acyl-sn-glycerol-3-phosphate acyltransferase
MTQPEPKVIYYAKTTDDFAGTNITTQKVDATFPYVHKNILWRLAAFLLYYVIALPLVTLYIRAVNRTRFVNRKALRKIKGGFFLYGNHTHWSDAFLPHVVAAMKRTYIVAGPDAVSIKGIRSIVQMVGGIPIPTQLSGMRQFMETVRRRCGEGGCIAVYPEAHIWPYYTGVRPFPATSFRYAAEMGVPVVAMAVVYRKSRLFKTPARTVTLSDPIYAAPDSSIREAQEVFYQRVSDFLTEKTGSPDNYAYIRYEQKL